MALLLKEHCPPDTDFTWVCTPTGNEPPEWFAHMRQLRDIIGPITPIMYPGGLGALIRRYNALPNWRQRWCTRILKIEPFAAFLARNAPAVFCVGLRADEEEREGGDYAAVEGVEMVFPLRQMGMGLADVWDYLHARNQTVPKRTDCMVCFFQRLIEWYELWRDNPEGYAQGEAWEAETGHTFRSDGRDSWPAALKDLRAEFEKGRIPRETRKDNIGELKCRVCRQ